MQTNRVVSALAVMGFLVSACGGEPSASNIQEAMEQQMANEGKAVGGMMGGEMAKNMQAKIHGVEKIACNKADGKPGYRCDFSVDIEVPILGRTTQNGSGRFVDGDDGWMAFRD
jgi:hypothetical protein